MRSRPVIFISAPYSAPTPWARAANVRRAAEVGLKVAHAGGLPLVPHMMWGDWWGEVDESDVMEWCLQIIGEEVDGIVLCPGWTRSAGCNTEHDHAEDWGVPRFVMMPQLMRFIKDWPAGLKGKECQSQQKENPKPDHHLPPVGSPIKL